MVTRSHVLIGQKLIFVLRRPTIRSIVRVLKLALELELEMEVGEVSWAYFYKQKVLNAKHTAGVFIYKEAMISRKGTLRVTNCEQDNNEEITDKWNKSSRINSMVVQ